MASSIDEVYSELYRLADTARNVILDFHPDLLIVLAHGGWAPYRALKTLWQETAHGDLPPTLVTNLGREKIRRYSAYCKDLPAGISQPFVGEISGDEEIGHFLNWLSHQEDWKEQFAGQIEAILGEGVAPKRVLFLDDGYFEGNTFFLAAGLLKSLYPDVELRFLAAACFEWRDQFANAWLEQLNLPLSAEEKQEISQSWFHFVPGTEDVDENSFSWKPITEDSAALEKLTRFLPAAKWLALPEFAYTQIEAEIRRRASLKWDAGDAGRRIVLYSGFSDRQLTYQMLWAQGRITTQQVASRLNITRHKAYQIVNRLVEWGHVVPCREGRKVVYTLSPELTQDLPDNGFLHEANWVVPGQLMIGSSPVPYGDEKSRQNLELLLQKGITHIFCLEDPGFKDLVDYEQPLRSLTDQRGCPVTLTSFDFSDRQRPSQSLVSTILDALDSALAGGSVIYLHHHYDDDCALLVAGCWLVRHGLTGEEALQKLDELRKNTSRPWLRAPARLAYRRMVKKWQQNNR
ncbi:MAG: BlaI/MecI/CopY family transcriptional regulator [Chloroflexi bacterium]|nr:BlaI/MecI/CopY family transcriptional regulator [Chloroflexota bacterium]